MCILRNEIHKYGFNNILKAQFSFKNMKNYNISSIIKTEGRNLLIRV